MAQINRTEAHILLGDIIRVLAGQNQQKTFATIGGALPISEDNQ